MRHCRRATALILTLILAVYGLPVSSVAQVVSHMGDVSSGSTRVSAGARNTEPEKPTTRMRFVQTGFNEDTGVLTMSLQIKPERGALNQTVSEGMFAFRVDANTALPITRPRKDPQSPEEDPVPSPETIMTFGERAAVVATKTGAPKALQEYLDSVRAVHKPNETQPEGTDFSLAMSSEYLLPSYTGYMVSSTRIDKGETTMLDCYLQFYFEWGKHIEPDADGYINVIDLDFQCYFGQNDDGTPKPAASTDCLFAGSIQVPKNQTEVDEILDQFYYVNDAGETVRMAMGGAGFIQKYLNGRVTREGDAYYYYDEPVITQWRSDPDPEGGYAGRAKWSAQTAQAIAGESAPGVWYDHVGDKYIVQGLIASSDNSFTGDFVLKPGGDPSNPDDYVLVEDPDFVIPTDSKGNQIETGNYPRYAIPTYEEAVANDEAGANSNDGAWIPEAYQRGAKQPLAYYLTTVISDNSISSPETEDLQAFLDGLKWEFVLDDGTRLSDCTVEVEDGEGKLIPTVGGNYYRVKEAAITEAPYTGSGKSMIGAKVWEVYYADDPENPQYDRYFMRAPVGVTFDMVRTQIRTQLRDGAADTEVTRSDVTAPQLHVTNEAADPQNYIWRLKSSGQVLFRPVYDPDGAAWKDNYITTRLYKNDSVVTESELQVDNLPIIQDNAGNQVRGFWVGTQNADGSGEETVEDAVSTGISVRSVLYDQYRIAYTDRWNTLEVVPTEAAKQAMEAAGKTEVPFEVVQVRKSISGSQTGAQQNTDEYTIKYKSGMTVNDAVEGQYNLQATYNLGYGRTLTREIPVYIRKPADHLSYIEVVLTAPHKTNGSRDVEENGVKGTVIEVEYNVPVRPSDGKNVTNTESLKIYELANQWRVASEDPSIYDIVPGVRSASSSYVDLEAAWRKGVSWEFRPSYPEGSAPRGISVNTGNGSFTYDSTVKGDAKFNLRFTATYQGTTRFVEYQFTFKRELQTLQQVVIYPPEGQSSYQITVPLKEAGTVSQALEVAPLDQYGSQWNWSDVEEAFAVGGRLNPEGNVYDYWKVYPVKESLPGGVMPEGVTLGNAPGDIQLHDAIVYVEPTAKTCEFQVYAQYASYKSAPMTISIVRAPSKPTTVQNLLYKYEGTNRITSEITSPGEKEADMICTPSLDVYDQYDEPMDDYDVTWEYVVTVDSGDSAAAAKAREYIQLGTDGKLTVKKCALDCTVTILAKVSKNGVRKSASAVIKVKRDTPRPESVTIDQESVKYPSSTDVSTSINQLTANGKTQYGDGQQYKTDELTWTLDRVEFADRSYVERLDPATQEETGDITNDTSRQRYTARNSVVLTYRGILSFNSVTSLQDFPEKVVVTAWYGGTIYGQKTITIQRDAFQADKIYIPPQEAYSAGVQIPAGGQDPVNVPLEAYIRNQYGVIMEESVEWSLVGSVPAGMSVDLVNKTVKVGYNTQPGSQVHLQAQSKLLPEQKWQDLYITARNDQPLEVASVEVTGVRDSTGKELQGGKNVTAYLPAKTETGYDSYTMSWIVRDQFMNRISRSVKWTVVSAVIGGTPVDPSDLAGIAQIVDENSGDLRLYFNENSQQALTSGRDVSITIRAESVDDASKYDEGTIRLSLVEPKPAYATAVVTKADGIYETDNGKPIVPAKGDAPNEILIEATVYDQYGQPMPGESAEMNLITLATGLKFTQAANTNSGKLTVESTVTGLMVNIRAFPKGMPESVQPESTLRIDLSKGPAYAASLELHESNQINDKNQRDFDIPYWEGDQAANVPSEDNTEELTLRAEVRDQYNAFMLVEAQNGGPRPVWEFVGDHEGVEFAEYMDLSPKKYGDAAGALTLADPDQDGMVEAEEVTLLISNRAVPAGQLEKTVTLRVHTSQKDGEDFEKIITLRLKREAPVATYLYITDSDEKGAKTTPLMRPYAEDGLVVYQFQPVVYDQYGAPMEDIEIGADINVDMKKTTLDSSNGIVVQDVYKKGESEENGNSPIGYEIYRVEYSSEEDEEGTWTLLGKFDRETGELTIYTECDCLDKLEFTAEYPPLGGMGVKGLTVPLGQEALRPYSVKIDRSHGNFVISGRETEPINDYIRPWIYDQYGAIYSGGTVIQWDLLSTEKNEAGEYLPYDTELDKDGNERPASRFLVLKEDSVVDGTTTLTVQPESFFENKTVVLRCIVIDANNPRDTSRWVYLYTNIVVQRPRSSGGGIIAAFDAGDYGKLVGYSEIQVSYGQAPENVPGVKTVEGYGFVGWTVDGKTVVDASKIPLTTNTMYMAVYKDITNTKFLQGYKDGTVRPEKAVTRAEFIVMLTQAFGGYDPNKDYGNSFSDVEKGKWYANYIAYAKQKGVALGYPDGTFRPNQSITRAEAAQLLATSAGLTEKGENIFSDVKAGAWYENSVLALVQTEVVAGYPDGTFRPRRQITRAEAVRLIITMTENALNELERKNIQGYAYCPFSDITRDHWAYAYILRAAGIA